MQAKGKLMGIQSHFINFHNKIKLSKTDESYSNARKRDDSITADIKEAFVEMGFPVIDDFIQGSFSTDTAIVNLNDDFDIDRAIVIDFQDSPDDPVKVKRTAYDVLLDRGFKNPKVKKPCVTADYSSERLHIDIPIYRLRYGVHELAVGKINSDENNKEWSVADPKGLKDWIKNNSSYGGSADSKQQQYNRIVRYLKRWRDEKFSDLAVKKVYSIGLTVMAKMCFSPYFNNQGQPRDLDALKYTVSNILSHGFFTNLGNDQFRVAVSLPVSPYRDIFDGSSIDTGTQLKNKMIHLGAKLNEAIAESNETKQCNILNSVFGADFLVPVSNSSTSQAKKKTYASAGAVGTSQGA